MTKASSPIGWTRRPQTSRTAIWRCYAPGGDVTQYTDWKWGGSEDLVPAAEKGSLCSRLYIAGDTGR